MTISFALSRGCRHQSVLKLEFEDCVLIFGMAFNVDIIEWLLIQRPGQLVLQPSAVVL